LYGLKYRFVHWPDNQTIAMDCTPQREVTELAQLASRCHELEEIISERRLQPVFQPIVDLTGGVLGYEGLIRGPSNSPLHSPVSLFDQAERCQLTVMLDRPAVRSPWSVLSNWGCPVCCS
jgi:predicted signal transduction protein with EAL and GGDEF domain